MTGFNQIERSRRTAIYIRISTSQQQTERQNTERRSTTNGIATAISHTKPNTAHENRQTQKE